MKNGIPCCFAKCAVIDDGIQSAHWHMEKDRSIIDNLSTLKTPILRFYQWEKPSITYGHFIAPEKYLKLDVCKELGLDVARRPTGGGILFHFQDFTFSVAIPKEHPNFSQNVLENYHFVNSKALGAIEEIGSLPDLAKETTATHFSEFCMAQPTKYDLLLNGFKIGGAAQRMTRYGFVHQASIFLAPPPWDMLEAILIDGKSIVQAMKATSASLGVSRHELKKRLVTAMF